ncbi:MAG: porin family protein [Treponema sp.]|nr:porin family protein [Treponema sp.]
MKRSVLVLALAACVAGGAFTQSLFSAGGGGIFNYGKPNFFGAGVDEVLSSAMQLGGFIFFDVREDGFAAELSAALLTGPLTGSLVEISNGKSAMSASDDSKATMTALDFALLFKIPLVINNSFFWYPFAGVGYNYILSIKYESGGESNKPSDLSTMRFHFGIGGDYTLTEKIYLRGQLIGFLSAGYMDEIKEDGSKSNIFVGGFGGTFKLGVGYKF